VAVEKGTKKVISGEPAPFLKRIFNDLRTDFTAISAQEQFFNSRACLQQLWKALVLPLKATLVAQRLFCQRIRHWV
jgi:hypothetical protein